MFRPAVIFNHLKHYRKSLHTSSVLHTNDQLLKSSDRDGVREIVFNDPKTRNALSMNMMTALIDEISRDWDDLELRCMLIASTGSIYSSGHNLKELQPDRGYESHREIFAKCGDLMRAIREAPVPIIAKVDGLAAAAGCQLAASCDIVVCTERSSFSTPGANFGLFCSTPGIALARTMPRNKALYMLFTGLPISAQDAYIAGLVSSVVPPEKLDKEIEKICNSIKAKSRDVIQLGKQFFNKQINMNVEEAYRCGEKIMADNLGLPDGKEGIMSFVEKRPAQWKS